MKKILFAILFLYSFKVFPQSSTTAITTRITDSITTNNGRQITGAILNRLLKAMNLSYVNKTTDPYVATATAPLVLTTNTITITQAATGANGYLSSTDWNTFNNKQAALVSGTNLKTVGGVTLLGSGDVTTPTFTTVTTSTLTAGTIQSGTTDNTYQFHLKNSSIAHAVLTAGDTSYAQLSFGRNSDKGAGRIRYNNADSSLGFVINLSEKLRIDKSGNVGIGTTSQNASTILDLTSTTKGFLPPRMTTTQRDAIVTPVNGMMIYNSTTGAFNGYQGGAWSAIGSAALFTDGGAYTYLTSTTDLFQVGSSTTLSASLGVKGQGATAGTTNRGSYNSSSTLLEKLTDAGELILGGGTAAGIAGTPLNIITAGVRTFYGQSTSTTGNVEFVLENNRGSLASFGYFGYGGSAYAVTHFGITGADKLMLLSSGANNLGILLGTENVASPIVFGINGAEVARYVAAGQLIGATTDPTGLGFKQVIVHSGIRGTYQQMTSAANYLENFFENNRGSYASYGEDGYGGSTCATTRFGLALADLRFSTTGGASNLGYAIGTGVNQPFYIGTNDIVRLTINGAGNVLLTKDLQFTTKVIDVTTGDAATINSPTGRFRKDATGTTFTLTDSYITANSIIILTPANAAIDATATGWTISAGSGTATITFNAAPSADFDMNFLIIN